MNDDISDLINNLNEIMGSDSSSKFGDLLQNLTHNNNNNSSKSSSTSSSNVENETPTDFNLDFETIMKMKNIMNAMNSKKNDPRSNLLLSLKPYLKDSRKKKLDQYIQLLNMSGIFDILKKNGGDHNEKL